MTKLEAIQTVGTAYASDRNSKTIGSALVRALRVLELDDDDILIVLIETGYASGNGIVMDGVKFDRVDLRAAPASSDASSRNRDRHTRESRFQNVGSASARPDRPPRAK